MAGHAAIVTRIRFEFDEYALPVEYRRLGGTDLELSSIVLGCGNFGGIGSAPELFGQGENEAEAFAIMDRAVAAGINVFDTAASYGGGRSESWIGSWRRRHDAPVLLSTKVYWSVQGNPADRGLSRERILREIEGSLTRLGVERVDMYLVHEPDQSPIGYQEVCKLEDKPVPDDEVVKAFEFEPGEYVLMEDEDFEAARAEGYRTIEITDFVPYEQVDPIYFARTYYLGPEQGGEKVYSLLLRALEDSGLAGISKFVMRDRQYLGALRVRDGVITLEQLYFHDEIRPVDEIKPPGEDVGSQ